MRHWTSNIEQQLNYSEFNNNQTQFDSFETCSVNRWQWLWQYEYQHHHDHIATNGDGW